MKIKDTIIQTLSLITNELKEVVSESYIIGGSAMILSDIAIGNTSDIDILTTNKGSEKLQFSLRKYMEITPKTKEDQLFRSNFARFHLPIMDIEVMGDLKVRKEDCWNPVCIQAYNTLCINNLFIRIPTLQEQIRILSLFGREKDLKRINLLKQYL